MPTTSKAAPPPVNAQHKLDPVQLATAGGIGDTALTKPPIDAWDGKAKSYRPELVALVTEATAIFGQAHEATAKIAELEQQCVTDARPYRDQQARVAWLIARKITEMRKRFEFRKVATGKLTPGSWPHFCRDILAKRGWLKDEKDASRSRRAIEYLEEQFPEFERKLVAGEKLEAVPMPYEVAPLKGIASEQKRKEIHAKVFSGELSGRALIAALPKRTTSNNAPAAYVPGNIADGAMQTLKRALDSIQGEGEAVWISNSSEGKKDAIDAFAAALDEMGVQAETRVCWAGWVKK